MAGVHGLQHVEGLVGPDFAQDHAVGTHPQRVLDQLALADLALALDVRRAGLHAHHVRLLQLQLGGVLDGDHHHLGDSGRESVEQGGLAEPNRRKLRGDRARTRW